MAAILIADCTVTTLEVAGFKVVKVITPNTANQNDTVDLSTLFSIGNFAICSNAVDGTAMVAAPVYGDMSVTLPGAEATEARTILAFGE